MSNETPAHQMAGGEDQRQIALATRIWSMSRLLVKRPWNRGPAVVDMSKSLALSTPDY